MVVLVRCFDDTIALALESRLESLKKEGLICGVLRNGTWVDVEAGFAAAAPAVKRRRRITATVASCCATM